MTIRELLAASGSGAKVIDKQTFTASGTWTKPAGVLDTDIVRIDLWGGGGSGGVNSGTSDLHTGLGGGGGAHNSFELLASELNSTEPVIVGAGGAAVSTSSATIQGNDGGHSEFKGRRAYGGTRGTGTPAPSGGAGGLGGGIYGAANLMAGAHGGEPQILAPYNDTAAYSSNVQFRWAPGEWGGGGNYFSIGVGVAQNAAIHGGGGCIVFADRSLRSSVWGGGAGGAFQSGTPVANVTELGGLSTHGGNGGDAGVPTSTTANANGTNGQPRGGGGGGGKRGNTGTATSGAGGRGEVVITVIRR